MKIVEYIGPENSQNVIYGTPFLVVGFCDGEWELAKTTWYDVKENHQAIHDLHDNLMVDICVHPEVFDKYFLLSTMIEE